MRNEKGFYTRYFIRTKNTKSIVEVTETTFGQLGSKISDDELIKRAKLLLKKSDCVVANFSEAMGATDSKAAIVDQNNIEWIKGSKIDLSKRILEKISSEI